MSQTLGPESLRDVQLLKDLEEIKRLKYDYCYFADLWPGERNDCDKVASLFADDGIWEVVPQLRSVGPAEIAKALKSMTEYFSTTLHIVMSPRIDLEGDRATGTWYAIFPGAPLGPESAQPQWCTGQYHEEYVRTPKGWRIAQMKIKAQFSFPFLAQANPAK
jgi:ketosteroid isomerase-like protein